MACLNPITKQIRSNPARGIYSVQVPCGKCINCLKKYQNSWFLRLSEECSNWTHFHYFTLTYNEDSVPCRVDSSTGEVYRTVNKQHLQHWLKRLRTRLMRANLPHNFKYFITSEYGPRTLRPHYHGIIFGVDDIQMSLSLNEWASMYGYHKTTKIPLTDKVSSAKVVRYISKYCSKGMFENPLVNLGKVDKTFHLISKKIGISYVDKTKRYHLTGYFAIYNPTFGYTPRIVGIADKQKVYKDGFYYAMPRYYKEKIYGVKNSLSAKIANFLLAQSDDLYRQQLRALQLQFGFSELEAFRYLDSQEISDLIFVSDKSSSDLAKFYNYSKL